MKKKNAKKKIGVWQIIGLIVGVPLGMFAMIALMMVLLVIFSGTFYETDPQKYEQAAEFFPESIAEYTVNGYSNTRYEYLDSCQEVFLDLTVNEEQFAALLEKARAGDYLERECYYAEGYYEIVYCDEYKLGEDTVDESESTGVVYRAHVEKVIYNAETQNVLYEYFWTNDTGVYNLEDVVYFRRFGIDEKEYVKHLPA